MHSHYGLQEQLLLSAPLIIRDGSGNPSQQEVVVMLADFSFTPPDQILAQLQARETHDMLGMEIHGTEMPAMEREPDLNDVRYDAFLANSRTLADPEVVKVEPGGGVRLRIINASSMCTYHLDLGQLEGDLIAVDGRRVQPVRGHKFPITVAQRMDIELTIPKLRPPIRCLRCWKASAGRPASCSLPGRDKLPAFPAWQRRHRHRSLSVLSVL